MPDWQNSSKFVPPEAPASPKTDQLEIREPFLNPTFQHPRRSTTPDSPGSPIIPESSTHPSATKHSGPLYHSSNTKPPINSTNSLSLGHRQQPSHQAHSKVPKNIRCNTCYWEAGTNPKCWDCRGGLADFRNLTSQTNGQTATNRCALCGKPVEKDKNHCMACKDKSVADWLVHDRRKNLYRN